MTGVEAIQDRENKRLCAALEATQKESDTMIEELLASEAEALKLKVILADIIRTLSEKDLAEVKFERARKKGINYFFDRGENP